MNRRGFLQIILAAAAAPAIVQAGNIMPVFMRRESGLLAPRFMEDLIRQITDYDITRDLILTRFDILVPSVNLRLSVDHRFYTEADSHRFGAKQIATELFTNELRGRGLSWADVRPLPIR